MTGQHSCSYCMGRVCEKALEAKRRMSRQVLVRLHAHSLSLQIALHESSRLDCPISR